jgi:hypothetical protein
MLQMWVTSAGVTVVPHFFHYQAKSLQFLDLSQTSLDKKAIEYIVASLATAPEPGLISLRLDDCTLRVPALDVLGKSLVFRLCPIFIKCL